MQSGQSDMGGRVNGYLGLVCTPEAYQSLLLEAQPYIWSDIPKRLQATEGLMQYSIM